MSKDRKFVVGQVVRILTGENANERGTVAIVRGDVYAVETSDGRKIVYGRKELEYVNALERAERSLIKRKG